MPKTYVSPALRRYGPVSELTASDFKCTPGGDGGFTYWDHSPSSGSNYKEVGGSPGAPVYTGNELAGTSLLAGDCRGVTQGERALWDIDTSS